MKERPILMHQRSILGILEGRKSQTRRIVKSKHSLRDLSSPHAQNILPVAGGIRFDWMGGQSSIPTPCPYGQPGDRLWVRETWQQYRAPSEKQQAAIAESIARIHAGKSKDIVGEVSNWGRADGERKVLYAADFGDWAYDVDSDLKPWRPSIFMPRWASRLTLEVTGIHVERVQDISEKDAKAEGGYLGKCACFPSPRTPVESMMSQTWCHQHGEEFKSLWDDTNGKGAWERNDWCWVVDFKRIEA